MLISPDGVAAEGFIVVLLSAICVNLFEKIDVFDNVAGSHRDIQILGLGVLSSIGSDIFLFLGNFYQYSKKSVENS